MKQLLTVQSGQKQLLVIVFIMPLGVTHLRLYYVESTVVPKTIRIASLKLASTKTCFLAKYLFLTARYWVVCLGEVSPHALPVFRFPLGPLIFSHLLKHASRWITYSKLPLGENYC